MIDHDPDHPDSIERWIDGAMESLRNQTVARDAEIARLRGALEPFAIDASRWSEFPDAQPLVENWPDGPDPDSELVVGDLRIARTALKGDT